MAPKQKYYVVWAGKKPGVYFSWAECEAQVKGFVGAKFKAYPTQELAKTASNKPPFWDPSAADKQDRKNADLPSAFLCVDAACSGSPGPVEWRVVLFPGGKTVHKNGPHTYGTNNIGEFLALVDAIQFRQVRELDLPIYTDSITALAWIRDKRCKTTLHVDDHNPRLAELIRSAEQFLRTNPNTTNIKKWDTEAWGEIPADYGRK